MGSEGAFKQPRNKFEKEVARKAQEDARLMQIYDEAKATALNPEEEELERKRQTNEDEYPID